MRKAVLLRECLTSLALLDLIDSSRETMQLEITYLGRANPNLALNYYGLYLKEEIQAEALIGNIHTWRDFSSRLVFRMAAN